MTGSWDSVLYFLNGRGGGQSEHERGREGGKDGPFNQHTDALACQAECARCCRDKYALKVHSSSDLPPQLHGWCIDVYMKMGAI